MLKEQDQLIHKAAVIIDCFIVGCAFFLAYLLRDNLHYLYPATSDFLHRMPPFREYAWMMIIVIPIWIMALSYYGMYNSMREKGVVDIFWNVFDASFLSTFIFAAIAFLLKLNILSRTFIIILFVCVILMLLIEKWAVLLLLHYIRQSGYNYKVLLIVGSGERARNFASMIEAHPVWGLKILGFIDEEERVGNKIGDGKVIGSFKDILRILDRNVVDEVVFILPRKWLSHIEDYITLCEKVGVKSTIAVDFFNTSIAKPVVTELHGWPLLTLETIPSNILHLAVKRFIDAGTSACGLVLLSPIFLLIALIIRITSSGPVFFKQRRCGLNGRRFNIYKFRTMVIDAEERLQEMVKFNERTGPIFKMKNDPRITGIGKLLRKISLDELPQLMNVLKGDMSLIGPRPPLPAEVEKYELWQRRRLSLRPGIACIHEVVARNDTDFERWMKLDLQYIDNWSLSLDFRIFIRSILAVLKTTGC